MIATPQPDTLPVRRRASELDLEMLAEMLFNRMGEAEPLEDETRPLQLMPGTPTTETAANAPENE